MIELTKRGRVAVLTMTHGKVNAMDLEFCRGLTAQVHAEYQQAKIQSDTDEQLAKEGLIPALNLKLSKVKAEELANRVAIMNRGKIVALGTPDELKAAVHVPGATLEDAFAHFTSADLESGGTYQHVRSVRRTAGRLR